MSPDQTRPNVDGEADGGTETDHRALEPAMSTVAPARTSGVSGSSASAVAYFEPHSGDEFELELDLPPRTGGPNVPPAASEPTPTAGIHKPRIVVGPTWQRPAPSVAPSSEVARLFLDEPSGVLRVWVVALMITVCVAATLAGRLLRMRSEAIREATVEAAR